MSTEYDFELWQCLTVNTHPSEKIISTEQYNDILSLSEVIDGVRLGSYGMELALIVDTGCREGLKAQIDKILVT